MPNPVLIPLQKTIETLLSEFSQIPEERKPVIQELTDYIILKRKNNQQIKLNFICTHNSRRSHIAQLWAQTASFYFGIANVEAYSGGTEATAFNPRAVIAMKHAGFDIRETKPGTNPIYEARYSFNATAVVLFSKKYDDPFNPNRDFVAVMTCSHADENCPLVTGATKRIALTYNDPKDFDGTPQEAGKYQERVREIGREIVYAFSRVK